MNFLDMVGIAAKEFDCTVDEIMSPVSRKHGPLHITDARACLQYHLRKCHLWTHQRIAGKFSLKNHSTVVKNCAKLESMAKREGGKARLRQIVPTLQKLKQAYEKQSETAIHGA